MVTLAQTGRVRSSSNAITSRLGTADPFLGPAGLAFLLAAQRSLQVSRQLSYHCASGDGPRAVSARAAACLADS